MIRFPGSRLSSAIMALLLLGAGAGRAGQSEYEVLYQKARTAYYSFKADKEKQKFRHNWQNVAAKFELVIEQHPESPRAPDALYTAGRLYWDLYLISRVSEDLDSSVALFRRLVDKFPDNSLADDAQMYIALRFVEFEKDAMTSRQELAYLIEKFPEGDVAPKARRMLEDLGGPGPKKKPAPEKKKPQPEKPVAKKPVKPVLEKIRHWSNPGYTRISLYTRTKAKYRYGSLEADPKRKTPPLLYIDLVDSGVGSDLSGPITVKDSVVRRIRYAERQEGFIRVVVELDAERQHRVFPMNDPERVVVDVTATEDKIAKVIGEKLPELKKPPKKKIREMKKKSKPGVSLSMMAGLKVKTVVIDPGHGGKDPGAIGKGGLLEKDVALDLAKRLKKLFEEKTELKVMLTRNKDRFLALEARTAFANKRNADLFISIHLNAHPNRNYRGVETFYLDLTNDRYSIKLAARENATSEKSISDLKFILADLALKSHVDDSINLSKLVQRGMVKSLRKKYKRVKDLGLKPALFYVLIGARMPSILVEASFISNPAEEKRLRSGAYRQQLAEGIYHGVAGFIAERERLMDPDE